MGNYNLTGLGIAPEVAAKLSKRKIFVPAYIGKQGATGTWTTANNTGDARVAASQTGATFALPLTGLQIGDVVVGFKVIAQIESAGNTVTFDADLRKLVNAAADPTDSSLGAITQVSVTADTAVASTKSLSTAERFDTGEMIYCLFTVTTGASTDVRLLGIEVNIERV
jgi:hypothetical protein